MIAKWIDKVQALPVDHNAIGDLPIPLERALRCTDYSDLILWAELVILNEQVGIMSINGEFIFSFQQEPILV